MVLTQADTQPQPRQVLLCSGHMTDAPARSTPRSLRWKQGIAAQKIAESLQQLDAGPEDLAFTQGACGGDLLFTEACQQRGVTVQWLQPFAEAAFMQESVVCHDKIWRARYLAAKARLTTEIRSATRELGPLPAGSDAYERCNVWLIETALSYGIGRVHLICLWDGGVSDRPGGTAHMYDQVKRRGGQIIWIDTRNL